MKSSISSSEPIDKDFYRTEDSQETFRTSKLSGVNKKKQQ